MRRTRRVLAGCHRSEPEETSKADTRNDAGTGHIGTEGLYNPTAAIVSWLKFCPQPDFFNTIDPDQTLQFSRAREELAELIWINERCP